MKPKLVLLVRWSENKERTWSGVPMALYKSLSAYYDVKDVNLSTKGLLRFVNRFAKLPFLGTICGVMYDVLLQLKVKILLKPYRNIPVLQIAMNIKIRNPYFTYQDLSYRSGFYLKELHEQYSWLWWKMAGQGTYYQNELKRRTRRELGAYKSAQAAFFMGSWMSDYMKEVYPALKNKFYAAGGGANKDFTRIQETSKARNKILFVGKEFERKGGILLLDAFRILRNQYLPVAELHIVGGPKTNYSSNETAVFFYGNANQNVIYNLLYKCDIFCMPSRFEAYGLVFVESLIFGLPCIGRDMFEMSRFIKEGVNGSLIKDDDAPLLAEKMFHLLKNDEVFENVKADRDFYIREFSWKTVASKIREKID